jgi:hypothetical protein
MTTEEQTTETQVSEVQKSDDVDTSVTSILAQLVKAQEARIDSFEKRFDGLETLIKEHNKNPVDQGVEDDTQAPAVSSPNDVGDPDNLGNTYAPSPKDQASIVPPQKGESPKTDAPSLTMGKADDEDKKEEDKEEVEKTEDHDEDKKEDVKKSESSEYEIVKTVRPLLKSRGEEETVIPTGYQILKAISSGWNGQTSSAEDALVIAYNKLESGEFGNGLPGGY